MKKNISITRKFFMMCYVLVFTSTIIAQDMIFKTNGEVIEGKVVEITDLLVKYKKINIPGNVIYSIAKSNVSKIVYANGKEEIINATNTIYPYAYPEEYEKLKFDSIVRKKKNIVGWDAAQFIYVSAGMAYERFFGKLSQFSIRIPFSFGFYYIGNDDNLIINDNKSYNYYNGQNDNYYIYQKGKIFGSSLEFNYYPFGMGKLRYFLGCYAEWGYFAYRIKKEIKVQDPYGGYYLTSYVEPMRYDGQHIAGGINNGFIYHINQWLTITGNFGLGLKKDETVLVGDKILTQVKLNLIFGIKF
ncbi:MAG: hypothetical protein KatS3mg027_1767 [Bacteroidia bacterium]|nr:MAG: hypothetical protein KatS3mg027_1767 [Bacteroidia bacterium]